MNHVAERPTTLIDKPVIPAKPCNRTHSDNRGGNFSQKIRLFEGLGHVPEDAEVEDNLAPLRRRQPKAVTPEQKRWTQIDTTENTLAPQWMAIQVSPGGKSSSKHKTLPPTPPPRLLSPSSPSRVSPPSFAVQQNQNVLQDVPKPKPRPRTRISSPDLNVGIDFSEGPNQAPPASLYPPTLPVPYHKKTSDSTIYVPAQRMAYNREKPRPRARTSQFDNGTYDNVILGSIKEPPQRPCEPPQRPRASTDLSNGRTKAEQAEVRQSVLELAQSFGDLKTSNSKDISKIERPKTLGYPIKNGDSNNVTKSNPDLLSDHSDEPEEPKSPEPEVKLGQFQRRLSKSLSEFNPIEMPEMDPAVYANGTGQLKSPASQTRPVPASQTRPSPVSQMRPSPVSQTRPCSAPPRPLMPPGPSKPKRTYEHDIYVRSKSQRKQSSPKSNVTQTMSAVPHIGRNVSPLSIPPSINAKKNHYYEDVAIEEVAEDGDDKGYLLPSPPTSPVSSNGLGLSGKPSSSANPISQQSTRPTSALNGRSKSPRRGKLERSKRISHSSESLTLSDDYKISGEYAKTAVALESKRNNEKTERKPEYSEPYLQRSSSDESLLRQPRVAIEDSEGYTVPGSHLWSRVPDKEEAEQKIAKRAWQNVMRHKIQSAFSRKNAAKVEEDTLSVTSEDSDIDVNDTVLKKRLTHVRAVRRRTSAYCSLEWYRKTMQYSKLYEYVVVVSLKFNKETRRQEPVEIKRFPHEISDSHHDKLRAIPLFCFPDAFKWAKVEQYNSESYSFVLTSVDGSRLYGYNRRLLPPGDGPRLPEVYCVMSPIGCASLYNELLDEIERRRQVSMQAVEVLLKTARDNPFPRPGDRLRIKMPIGEHLPATITKPLIIHRPTDSRLEQMNFECLFDSLDVAKVIQVFASLLLERRVVMCSSKLSKLSSCSQAIAALLYPFAWQHVYVPVLPEKLIDMCCSPTPYIMGMLSLCIPKLDEMPGIDEVIVVDLDSKDFYFLVGDEETILPKKLYVGLQRALSFVQKGSSENINNMAELGDPENKNAMISEAFIHFFVETCGHYSNHFSHQYDGTLKFDRDGFLNAVRSRSTRRFLEVFSETQMFSLFIQEKETESEGICQGLFERRVKSFEREKANNATFSTKMKKIVKDSGLRFALPRSRLKPTK